MAQDTGSSDVTEAMKAASAAKENEAPRASAFEAAVAANAGDDDCVVDVRNLQVQFHTEGSTLTAVDGISLKVHRGRTLALVGESGSGKSVTSLSIMRLIEHGGGTITQGEILLKDRQGRVRDLCKLPPAELREVRGADVAMIFQEPMTSLTPVFTVGEQIAESLRLHRHLSEHSAAKEAVKLLKLVRIPDAPRIAASYPHQLSGGMRQRVMIAMALACKPALLIADEPTTALDVTIQAQILALIRSLQKKVDMGVLFITHDMGVVAEIADDVAVMRYGKIVERGPVEEVFAHPKHPYTRALLAAVPRLGSMKGTQEPERFKLLDAETGEAVISENNEVSKPSDVVLSVRDICKRFVVRTDWFGRPTHRVHACEHVSFDLRKGETLALVGESGCGKSTTGRAVLRLLDVDSGSIIFNNRDITRISASELKNQRRNMQMIFQDPFASLDPRMTVGYLIAEPMLIHGITDRIGAEQRVKELLERVGLSPSMASRYPHEFSGGQRQRVCIARALALNPEVIVADESVAALDVSIRAQVVNLMLDLQQQLGLSFIFISHDMGVVERISHRVAVMYLGQIVEIGSREEIFEHPLHPYTQKLLRAVPIPDPLHRKPAASLELSELPSPVRSVSDVPLVKPLIEKRPGHFVAEHTIGGQF
ncbi:MAG: dipeptide ABC transporter ATP-binding protein [Duodenibacillus sp.]|nr:dipeptide ABC transporter ATP-binding protein [Duodenibacillus sp.]